MSVSFNPRTHTGCDVGVPPRLLLLECFNPRTHTGCDKLKAKGVICNVGFNPRTHTGCDGRALLIGAALTNVSIHAPTRGATHTYRN